jgi:6-phosphogluconolactonase
LMRLSIAAANRASIVLLAGMLAGCSNTSPDSRSLPLIASAAAQSGAEHSRGSVAFAYVVNLGSNDVSAYSIDAASGKLKQVNGSPFGAGSGPYGITVDPTGEFAYVPNSGSNNISAYSINATSGALKKVKGSPFGAGTEPFAVAADPAGKFVYVVNKGSNNISAYAIDATNGALTPVNGSPFSTGLRPDAVAVDPSGKFAYIPNSGSNNVSAYAIDATSGALTPVKRSPFRTGIDPFSVTVTPTGKFAYVAAPLSDDIYGYAIDPGSGALSPLAGSPFPDPGSEPFEVVIAPSGRFAFATNGFAAAGFPYNVSAYAIDSTRGTLTPVQGSPFVDPGSLPYSGAVDSTSRFVYITNGRSNDVIAYRIGASGALRKAKGPLFKTGALPAAISVCRVTAGKCIPPPL